MAFKNQQQQSKEYAVVSQNHYGGETSTAKGKTTKKIQGEADEIGKLKDPGSFVLHFTREIK